MEMQHKERAGGISRRDFLKAAGSLSAASWLAVSIPASALIASIAYAQDESNIVYMVHADELTDDDIAQFEADNLGISLTRIDVDPARFFAMLAAGNAPDLVRTSGPEFPQQLARNIPMNLQTRFEASSVLYLDDLAGPNNYYKATSPLNIGEGDIYAMCTDWSPDFSLWINENLFEEAGVEPPSDTEPMSYEELFDLARQLTKYEGDRVETVGFSYNAAVSDRFWIAWLRAINASLYSEDSTKANIVNNEAAREAMRYHFDLARERISYSPLNPTSVGPHVHFATGDAAIVHLGFWVSGYFTAQEDETLQAAIEAGRIKMIPAPIWKDGERIDTSFAAVGAIITDSTPAPDAAWRVFEWYMGEGPAIARASSGYGVPGLNSLFDLIPKEGTFREQVWAVLAEELKYSATVLPFNPYVPGGAPGAVASTWLANWEQALTDQITFDDLVQLVEDDTNIAIQEGIERIGSG